MKTLICIDRDGTLTYDEKFLLGSTEDWHDKIQFCPKVVEGLKKLNEIDDVGIYIITNQIGVAIEDFPLYTEELAREITKEVIVRFKTQGAHIDGFFHCPHVPPSYVESHPQYKFDEKLVCECDCYKPGLGMVFDALKKEGVTKEDVNLFVVGDRTSDVETGISAGGKGVLVPFLN